MLKQDAAALVSMAPGAQRAVLSRVATDSPTAVLLVDVASRQVLHANTLACQLAPGVVLPVAVDEWSAAAGLRDLQGRELTGSEYPLSVAATEVAVAGRPVSAERGSSGTSAREPLFAVGLPLHGTPGLDGLTLVVLLPLRDSSAVLAAQGEAATAQGALDRAVLATGCAFTLVDANHPDWPLRWVNPAFTSMTGYLPAEVVGRNCRLLQGPDTDRGQVEVLRAALKANRDVVVVLLNYRKNGTAFWNQLSVSPVLDSSGVTTHFVGVQTDVTDRVEAEQLRDQALSAERTARADAEQAREQAETARAEAELARARVELLGRRLSFVAEATGLLATTLDVEQSLDRLVQLIVPVLADWVVINLFDDQERPGPVTVARHRDGQLERLARFSTLVPAAVHGGSRLHAAMTARRPVLMADYVPTAVSQLAPSERPLRELTLELGAQSLMFVPLTARRRVVGTMMLVHGPSGRHFTDEDLDLSADLGRRAGLAVDNAQLYTREHAAAVTLQHTLLPVLPHIPGLALAAQYRPAGPGSQVGGDWWDVFALPDGATGLAIGDVMGHDIAAAAAMGQLRSVLRTCAWQGEDPATVLDRMDQLVQGFEMAQLATCIYARLEAAGAGRPDREPTAQRKSARLTWSNAGHLPPVLLDPDGSVRLLTDGFNKPSGGLTGTGAVGVPIGVPADQDRSHHALSVPAGSTLLLYTDGLVETRDGDIDSDLQRLLEQVGAHRPDHGPQALVDRLLMAPTNNHDDIAILAVKVL